MRRRRTLQVALGFLWLLDAGLQSQPFMFGSGFASQVIEPAAHGNPALIARPELWAAHAIAANPLFWNWPFATMQLALALGLFWPRTVKLALAASVPYSLGVWWLGEGFGGVLAGSASPIAGAPGPVILYALLAGLLWPAGGDGDSVASSSLGRRSAVAMWGVLWASEAYFALLPANRSGSALHDTIAEMSDGAPRQLIALGRWTAGIAAHNGAAIGIGFALATLLVALAPVLPKGISRPLLALAIVGAGLLWVLGQNLGGIFTGQSTDPNSGPLLALLALAYWPLRRVAEQAQ